MKYVICIIINNIKKIFLNDDIIKIKNSIIDKFFNCIIMLMIEVFIIYCL